MNPRGRTSSPTLGSTASAPPETPAEPLGYHGPPPPVTSLGWNWQWLRLRDAQTARPRANRLSRWCAPTCLLVVPTYEIAVSVEPELRRRTNDFTLSAMGLVLLFAFAYVCCRLTATRPRREVFADACFHLLMMLLGTALLVGMFLPTY